MQEMNHIVKGFRPEFNKKNIDLSITGPDMLLIESDKQLLNQAVYNLITNAFKFTPRYGKVNIRAYKKANEYIIEIKDNGSGILEEDMSRLFDAYYRGKNTGSLSGKGLGLYIAANNIKALGGELRAANNNDIGACFIIILKKDSEISEHMESDE